jgi:hypothetical protein
MVEAFNPNVTPLSVVPVIDEVPFRGTVFATYSLFLPPIQGCENFESVIRYHFDVRPGVFVLMHQPDKFHLNIVVILDENQYVPVSPQCEPYTLEAEDIDSLSDWPQGATRSVLASVPLWAHVLEAVAPLVGAQFANKLSLAAQAGFISKKCRIDPPPVPSKILSDNKIDSTKNQPYLIVGWVTMSWTRERPILLSPGARESFMKARLFNQFSTD